jgi:hypothetical protein
LFDLSCLLQSWALSAGRRLDFDVVVSFLFGAFLASDGTFRQARESERAREAGLRSSKITVVGVLDDDHENRSKNLNRSAPFAPWD